MKLLAMLAVGCLTALTVLLLVACGSSGPVRRVSEPSASIQQLTVAADGSWSVLLRIENFSSVPMRFGRANLALSIAGEAAGALQGETGVGIGPESADTVTLAMTPTAAARLRIADALAGSRGIDYTLKGRIDAAPENGGTRSYEIDRSSRLNPVPGLPGVLR